MAQNLCYLCRAHAEFDKKFEQESCTLLTTVECSRCGSYRLTPRAWTSHERSCLAAYVRHENKAGRQPPVIHDANWETLVKLGEALLERRQ